MDKGLLFFTFAAACFWLVFDDFSGEGRLSGLAARLTPDLPGLDDLIPDAQEYVEDRREESRGNAIEKSFEESKETNPDLDQEKFEEYQDENFDPNTGSTENPAQDLWQGIKGAWGKVSGWVGG